MIRNSHQARDRDWEYFSSAECILKEGLHFKGELSLPGWIDKGEPKECYRNASNLVMRHDNLRYVEGYATFHSIPIEHAWVYDMVTGQYHDPTWTSEGPREYYGVVFANDYILSMMVKTGRYGMWGSESYQHLMPVMQEGFPDWAIHKFGINRETK